LKRSSTQVNGLQSVVLRALYAPHTPNGANTRHASRMRKALLVLVAGLAIAAPAQARARKVDRGIIAKIRPAGIVLVELDGSRVRIPVSRETLVTVDGRPAALVDLRRGEVAFVLHVGRRPAVSIRAFTG
jgi:hypothetical protein